MRFDHSIVWAHAQVAVGQQALKRRELGDAVNFAQSAMLGLAGAIVRREVELTTTAAEALVKASRVESWGWHYYDELEQASAAARRGRFWADSSFPRQRPAAHARLRQIEGEQRRRLGDISRRAGHAELTPSA